MINKIRLRHSLSSSSVESASLWSLILSRIESGSILTHRRINGLCCFILKWTLVGNEGPSEDGGGALPMEVDFLYAFTSDVFFLPITTAKLDVAVLSSDTLRLNFPLGFLKLIFLENLLNCGEYLGIGGEDAVAFVGL